MGTYTVTYKDTNTVRGSTTKNSFTTYAAEIATMSSTLGGLHLTRMVFTETSGGKVNLDTSLVHGKLGDLVKNPILAYNGEL